MKNTLSAIILIVCMQGAYNQNTNGDALFDAVKKFVVWGEHRTSTDFAT